MTPTYDYYQYKQCIKLMSLSWTKFAHLGYLDVQTTAHHAPTISHISLLDFRLYRHGLKVQG